jgi:uncharacterized protein YkwD
LKRRFLLPCILVLGVLLAGTARASTPLPGFADQAFALLNDQRIQAGLTPLVRLRDVELAAQLHAMDMANREYMAHDTAPSPAPLVPDPQGFPAIAFQGGMSAGDRMDACGYAWTELSWGENIAWNRGYEDQSATHVVEQWMTSPDHRDNVLYEDFRASGLGCAVSASGRVYYCQVFVFGTRGEPVLNENADLWTDISEQPGDTTPPGSWSGFSPASTRSLTPTCQVRVSDSGSGLAVRSARYRSSGDGGATWGGWRSASCSGADGSTSVQTIRASRVRLRTGSAARNLIQFQIADVDGNTGVSPPYAVVKVR